MPYKCSTVAITTAATLLMTNYFTTLCLTLTLIINLNEDSFIKLKENSLIACNRVI